jgi:hypothetical protein
MAKPELLVLMMMMMMMMMSLNQTLKMMKGYKKSINLGSVLNQKALYASHRRR